MNNPLLTMDSLPPFSQIKPEQVQPAVIQAIADCKQKISDVLAQREPHTWDSLIAPLEEVNDRLSRIWSPVSHLNSVLNSEALREAHDACLPLLSEFQTYVGQHEGLYQAYLALSQSDDFPLLSGAQRKEIQNTLRDFRLSGIGLPAEAQQRYGEIQARLSELASRFSNNVLDATQGWHKLVADEAELAGLPDSVRAAARQMAEAGRNLSSTGNKLDEVATKIQEQDDADMLFQGETGLLTEQIEFQRQIGQRKGADAKGILTDSQKWFDETGMYFGTDGTGADVFSWLLAGSHTNLVIVLLTVVASRAWGLLLIAAMVARNAALASSSVVVVDALISVPTVLIALILAVPLGASIAVIVIACGFGYGLNLARVARPAALLAARSSYVESALANGASGWRVLISHVMPNILPVLAVQLSLSAGTAVLAESGLTYLGIGVPSGVPSWGHSLATSVKLINVFPLTVVWPGLIVTVVVVALNIFGDVLRDAIDPVTNPALREIGGER